MVGERCRNCHHPKRPCVTREGYTFPGQPPTAGRLCGRCKCFGHRHGGQMPPLHRSNLLSPDGPPDKISVTLRPGVLKKLLAEAKTKKIALARLTGDLLELHVSEVRT